MSAASTKRWLPALPKSLPWFRRPKNTARPTPTVRAMPAIANVKRLCELRDASEHKPIVHAAISMALGCSIAGAVDPNEVIRLVEKCFEAGVDFGRHRRHRRLCRSQSGRRPDQGSGETRGIETDLRAPA